MEVFDHLLFTFLFLPLILVSVGENQKIKSTDVQINYLGDLFINNSSTLFYLNHLNAITETSDYLRQGGGVFSVPGTQKPGIKKIVKDAVLEVGTEVVADVIRKGIEEGSAVTTAVGTAAIVAVAADAAVTYVPKITPKFKAFKPRLRARGKCTIL